MRQASAASRLLPGFGPTLGFALFYLTLVVLIPLAALLINAAGIPWAEFRAAVVGPRCMAAYRLSFGLAFAAALANVVFGGLLAWVLTRYRFPGRRLADALVDLPFALPTAVAGIALTAVFAPNGWIGRWLEPLGIKAAFSPVGIFLAMVFIGLPFVVRTLQPVLEDLDREVEEAATSLGASRGRTFVRVLFPAMRPSLLTGCTMAFARALGEYGSIVFISGNMPLRTEVVPLLIVTKIEQFDYAGAMALSVVMLAASFLLLLLINHLQARSAR